MKVAVPKPSKIICAGLNYYDHCREIDVAAPRFPVSFTKHPTAMIMNGDAIRWPEGATEKVDFEAELGVVIGREGTDISEQYALDYVLGYTIVNDVSARDVQNAEKQWVRCKSFNTFCPVGPHVVTADEIQDPQVLEIITRVNGLEMQHSNTREMIFSVAQLIARFSQGVTLLPGDIISTGTPGGVGVFRNPPVFLKSGDVVEIEIERIGVLSNPVAGPYETASR